MNEKPKNDLMFLQNEILGDIKNVENKLDNKIFKISKYMDEQNSYYDKKINQLENILNIIKEKTQNLNIDNSKEKDKELINSLNKKIEDNYSKLDAKVSVLRVELKDATYKYEKSIVNTFHVPYLIGEKCPYSSIRDFFENMHKKINESLRHKDQQGIELKKYKEKMDLVLSQNKAQLPMFENRITTLLDSQIRDLDNKYKERIDIIEERINNMRIENGQYSTNLIEQCNILNDKCLKIDDIINNSLVQYKEEVEDFQNSLKDMKYKLKNFEEQCNTFEEKLIFVNELNDNIKQMKDNIKFDNKPNEINNNTLPKKEAIENDEEIKNKSNIINTKNDILENSKNISKSNINEYNLQNEEMEINSLINSKQNVNKDDNATNKLIPNERNKKNELKKRNNKINYCNLIKNYTYKKKSSQNFFDESYEHTKINNIIFDAEFFKKSSYLGSNSSINDYTNKNYRIKRARNLFNNRIKSGKLSHVFPFIMNDNINDEQPNNINSRNNNADINMQRSAPEDFEVYDNNKNENFTIYRSQNTVRRKNDLDSSDSHFPPNHKYSYLDKKIDILSNVMVDSINKIIFQINQLKKNNTNNNNNNIDNQTNSNEKNNGIIAFKKKSLKNSLSAKLLFQSTFSHLKKVNPVKRGKPGQKIIIINKVNDIKTNNKN